MAGKESLARSIKQAVAQSEKEEVTTVKVELTEEEKVAAIKKATEEKAKTLTKKKTRRPHVPTALVLELYQECHKDNRTFKDFVSDLERLGRYPNARIAKARWARARAFVQAKYGVKVVDLRAAPQMPTTTRSLMATFSSILETA